MTRRIIPHPTRTESAARMACCWAEDDDTPSPGPIVWIVVLELAFAAGWLIASAGL